EDYDKIKSHNKPILVFDVFGQLTYEHFLSNLRQRKLAEVVPETRRIAAFGQQRSLAIANEETPSY
ncbi:MAG: hypothetical protein P8080_12490, partial [Gammaproteobacteria bacterium]